MNNKDRDRSTPGGKSSTTWIAKRLDLLISSSHYEKSLFITLLIVVSLVFGILGIWLNLVLTEESRIINRVVVEQAIGMCTLFLAGNLILLLVYYYFGRIRAVKEIPIWLLTLAVLADVGQVSYVVYLLGLYSSGIIIPIITVFCARVLFGRMAGILTLILTCFFIILFSIMYIYEVLPYGPFFNSDVGQLYTDPVLNLTTCGLTIFIILLFYGVMDFVTSRMHDLSFIDGLTMITNRRFFMEILEMEFQRAQRQGRSFSVVMIDLDHFKEVNDKYGHLVGDRVLTRVAQVIRKETRLYDSVARYGGEEFVMLLPDTDLEEAMMVAERCRHRIGECAISTSESTSLNITASMGLVHYPNDTVEKVDDLVRLADKALYRAKAAGRNQMIVSDECNRQC
jgi:diguanylate cyclase (GGDEF)-like protein